MGCGTKNTSNSTDIDNAIDTSVNRQFSYNEYTLKSKDSIFNMDGKEFTLVWTAYIDTTQKLTHSESYLKNGKEEQVIYGGDNAIYTVSLRDAKLNEVFTTIISKSNFKGLLDPMILTLSDAFLPDYLGYQSNFDAFLFTVTFYKPESDIGDQCFFMVSRKGEMKELFWTNYLGGPNCPGTVEISDDGKTIVTCTKIIKSDGTSIDITTETVRQVDVKMINDNCILVISEYSDSLKLPNAVLMDNNGITKKRFVYKGYIQELEYHVPIQFDSLSNSYFLLDESGQNLRIIDKNSPLKSNSVSFEELQKSGAVQEAIEREFELEGEKTKYTLFIDTLTKKIRMDRKIF